MRKLITNLFVITTIIFAVVYFLERKNAKKLEVQLVQKEQVIKTTDQELAVLKSDAAKLKKAAVEYKSKVAELKSSKEELTAQVKQHTEKLEEIASTEGEKKEGTAAEKFSSGLSEMMESPEMQDTVRMQLENTLINPVFGKLIKDLGLNDDDSEAFRTLLSDRLMIGATLGMKMMNADKEQRVALKNQIKEEEEAVDSMIKEMLGEEGYRNYKEYEDTMGERMALSQFNQQLGMSGENLTPDQNDQIISTLYEERLAAQKNADYFNPEDADISDYNDENIQRFTAQQKRITEKTLSRMKGTLSEELHKKLELFLLTLQQQQIMQIKLANKMAGGNK